MEKSRAQSHQLDVCQLGGKTHAEEEKGGSVYSIPTRYLANFVKDLAGLPSTALQQLSISKLLCT